MPDFVVKRIWRINDYMWKKSVSFEKIFRQWWIKKKRFLIRQLNCNFYIFNNAAKERDPKTKDPLKKKLRKFICNLYNYYFMNFNYPICINYSQIIWNQMDKFKSLCREAAQRSRRNAPLWDHFFWHNVVYLFITLCSQYAYADC